MAPSHPDSYATLSLPDILLSHHPASSPTATPIIIVTLNRPRAKNAFTRAMADSLETAFSLLSSDPRVRAVVLTGSVESPNDSPKSMMFCAGMDLSLGPSGGGTMSATRDAHRDEGGRATLAIYNCNKPVVAAINGSAVGVGITMTLGADIRVCSSAAKIGFVFSQRGICLEACSSFFLPRLLGASKAMHLATTGDVVSASDPLVRDLFSVLCDGSDRVLPEALGIAEKIAGRTSSVSTRVNKDLIFRAPASPEEAHLVESKLLWELFRGRDVGEGIRSFTEKRAPRFKGTVERDAPKAWPWWDTGVLERAKAKL